jgi:CRISPR/Cas system-associated exonuclease Cas4 (RecB family)
MQKNILKLELPAPFAFSQSSLQDYTDCARRFQLRYMEQLQWPAVETAPVLENERRQIEGQQFHRLVQQNLLGLSAEKLERMAFTENLNRWWEHFLTDNPVPEGSQLFPEMTLSAPLGQHRIMAKYDLVAIKNGKAVIYDWKTYHKRPKDAWMSARMQTKVYCALLVESGKHLNFGKPFDPEQIEMIYWYADFPDEPSKFTYNTTQYKHDRDRLTQLVSEITAKQSFPLTDDEKKCSYCPYRSYCERGVKAGEGEDIEDELKAADITLEQIQEIEF